MGIYGQVGKRYVSRLLRIWYTVQDCAVLPLKGVHQRAYCFERFCRGHSFKAVMAADGFYRHESKSARDNSRGGTLYKALDFS